MSTRLDEIAKRHANSIELAKRFTCPESPDYWDWYMDDWDARDIDWLIANARNAIAYCDHILSHNPNGAELMFLT